MIKNRLRYNAYKSIKFFITVATILINTKNRFYFIGSVVLIFFNSEFYELTLSKYTGVVDYVKRF